MTKKKTKSKLKSKNFKKLLLITFGALLIFSLFLFLLYTPNNIPEKTITISGNVLIGESWIKKCQEENLSCIDKLPKFLGLYTYNPKKYNSKENFVKWGQITWSDKNGNYEFAFNSSISNSYLLYLNCKGSDIIEINPDINTKYHLNLTLDSSCTDSENVYYSDNITRQYQIIDYKNNAVTSRMANANLETNETKIAAELINRGLDFYQDSKDENNYTKKLIYSYKAEGYLLSAYRAIRTFELKHCIDDFNNSIQLFNPYYYI